MPKKERDEALSELTAKIFSEMVEYVLMDEVLEAHQEIARSRSVCDVCHTRCTEVHAPGPSNPVPRAAGPSSRAVSPSNEGTSASVKSPAGGAGTPVPGQDGAYYLSCENCKRQIASNRFAQHLSQCMNLNSSRRGPARNATAKSKLASEAGRSASPYVAPENGHISDDNRNTASATKSKSKAKAKRTDNGDFSGNRKRPASPSVSPAKKSKKAKSAGSPITRPKADPDLPTSPSNSTLLLPHSQTKVPSKLRDSSFVSTQHDRHSPSPTPTHISSPARSVSTLASVAPTQSPILSSSTLHKKKPNGKPAPALPVKRPSPPRPPPPVIRMVEPDYLIDVEGDETGSSTDTDSS
ncbi:hypothetical protein OBBRIDRAFT_765459 [Obba rivulosa]|uniref:SAGA-associated factor 11 n=1 Tax=Obba rivulosa TaxID=1052685 RepID=A0A8E2J8C1_9APHY|nr:hypothetical protein OBBRIDRAFT_765459 [Obba rivulosa]